MTIQSKHRFIRNYFNATESSKFRKTKGVLNFGQMVDRKLTELPVKRAELSEKSLIQPIAMNGKKKGVFLTEENRMNGSMGFGEQKIKGACEFNKQIDRGSSIYNTNNLTMGLNYNPSLKSVKSSHVPSINFDKLVGREQHSQQLKALMEFKRYEYCRDTRYDLRSSSGGVPFDKMLPRDRSNVGFIELLEPVRVIINWREPSGRIGGISAGRLIICLMWTPSLERLSGGPNCIRG
jgi:hypothetical protein